MGTTRVPSLNTNVISSLARTVLPESLPGLSPQDSIRCTRVHFAIANHAQSDSRPLVRTQGNLTGITRAHLVSTIILHLRLSRALRDKRHRFTIHSNVSLDCRNRLSRSVEPKGEAGFRPLSRHRVPPIVYTGSNSGCAQLQTSITAKPDQEETQGHSILGQIGLFRDGNGIKFTIRRLV